MFVVISGGCADKSYTPQMFLVYSRRKLHKMMSRTLFIFVQIWKPQHMNLNMNTTIACLFGLTVGKSGSIWAPWSVMSIFSSPWLHTRQVVMRSCASVKHRLKMRLVYVIFFPSTSSLPLSNSPARFSQMEVAQHSRPALHNLRM